MNSKIFDIIFAFFFWIFIQLHFQFQLGIFYSSAIFLLTLALIAFRAYQENLPVIQICQLLFLLTLLYLSNSIIATYLPEIVIVSVVAFISSFIFYGLLQENHSKMRHPEDSFANNVSKFFLLFLALWSVNLLQIKEVLPFDIIAGIFSLTVILIAIFYYYFLERLTKTLIITITLVGLTLGAFKLSLQGSFFDPFGITSSIFLTVFLDLLHTAYHHRHIKKLTKSAWHQKLIFIFLLLILTIQIANNANFPQKLGAFSERLELAD